MLSWAVASMRRPRELEPPTSQSGAGLQAMREGKCALALSQPLLGIDARIA